jgi:hypothetical protein
MSENQARKTEFIKTSDYLDGISKKISINS